MQKFLSRKFILTISGLVAMLVKPEIAAHIVTLIGITVGGFSVIDYKAQLGKDK